MKSLEQQRAADALARVDELQHRNDTFRKAYRSYVDRLGPAIVMNGLGQAMATERAACGSVKDSAQAHCTLYNNVKQWLCRKDGVYPPDDDLLRAITTNDQSHYIHAQSEALAWLEWHKKCCRAAFPALEGDSE